MEISKNILTARLNAGAPRNNAEINAEKRGNEIGRNDECPCGSKKKFKKCGMLNTQEHQQNLKNLNI